MPYRWPMWRIIVKANPSGSRILYEVAPTREKAAKWARNCQMRENERIISVQPNR